MGTIIPFSVGCRRCVYLQRIGEGTYLCTERAHIDDSDVIPIKDGKQTKDWNICYGESYARK